MSIRSLFSTRRPIDRPIEKVIDYYATEEKRLLAEIEEYEATEGVERCFRKLIETYSEGVQGGQAAEIGVWVSGFYGAGKSSFTKYFGFALDTSRTVNRRPFLDFLCERFHSRELQASPSRMMRPCRSLTSLTPAWPTELVGVRRPSMKKTRTRGRV